MAFSPKKQGLQAAASTPAAVPGAAAMIVSELGPAKVKRENTGAGAAGDPVMQFNISGIFDT